MKMENEFRQLSNAQHFQRNRAMCGLDNPAKAGYTTVRELVENALDVFEMAGTRNPEIKIKIEEKKHYTVVIVMDNGSGIHPSKIPKAFGQIFYGTSFVLRQQRGRFGMGGTIVCMHGFLETTIPYRIVSAVKGSRFIHVFNLGVDLNKGEPIVFKRTKGGWEKIDEGRHEKILNRDNWHGTAVRVHTRINLNRLSKIISYLKLNAICVPHVSMSLTVNKMSMYTYKGKKDIILPPRPKIAKLHPKGVSTHDIQKLIEAENNEMTLLKFLAKRFQHVGWKTATKFIKTTGFKVDKLVKTLKPMECVRLAKQMSDFDSFLAPMAMYLSPITRENMIKGVESVFKPEFTTYVQRKGVYGGHAFIVEVAVGVGGNIPKPRKEYRFKLYRFANKIPLLYDKVGCVLYKQMMKTEKVINHRYQIDPFAKVAVFIHFASTKVPFKTEGKEYISADYPEINRVVRNALHEGLRQTRSWFTGRRKLLESARRHSKYMLYVPIMSESLKEITGEDKKFIYNKLISVLKIEEGEIT